jgi:2,4-dienoyl-CoA reductase-like NADH-dependent reductase (Old Yellow Enzyme family)
MNCSDYVDGDDDIDTYAQAAGSLVDEGVDLIEVSGGVREQIKLRRTLKKAAGKRESYFTHAIQPFRQTIGKTPLAVTGGLRSLKAIEKTLAEGADMVGVCRPIISEPDFPNIIFQSGDNPKARCISCNKCLLHIAEHPLKCIHFDQ